MMGRFAKACRSRPLVLAVVVSSVKTSAADLLVQTTVEDRVLLLPLAEPLPEQQPAQRLAVDWRRNAFFAAFGACYLGGVQYAIYTKLMPRLFSSASSSAIGGLRRARSVAGQVMFDQFLHVPLLFFPCFYVMKECMESECLPWVDGTAQRGLTKYAGNAVVDIKDQLSVFGLGALVNFAVMPLWLRTPWVAAVSFVYTLILSSRRGNAVG
jgi:hypothetical protein